jgi:predicted Zn-ribbon and HTH transcriptional regulator
MADNGNSEERDLKGIYGAVQSGIWLIGLALLAWQGAWWPGILILVAISGITQAVLQGMAKRQASVAETANAARAAATAVPPNCPTCGAAINASSVVWSGPTAAQCPYCKSAIPLKSDATTAKEQKS